MIKKIILTIFISLFFALNAFAAGIDSNAVLVLHCDGSNGSTSFPDSSSAPKTQTANGNAQVSTANFEFSTGSYLGDGSGDYITTPHDTDFDWSGDFTVDCWILTSDATTDVHNRRVWSRGDVTSAGSLDLAIDTNGHMIVVDSFLTGTNEITGTTNCADGIWRHIEVSRSGSSLKLFVSGTQEGSTFTTSENYNQNSTFDIGIGAAGLIGSWHGNVDELRVSKGIARHTANFTPPTSPYSVATSGNAGQLSALGAGA